jgi:hypothetical protein
MSCYYIWQDVYDPCTHTFFPGAQLINQYCAASGEATYDWTLQSDSCTYEKKIEVTGTDCSDCIGNSPFPGTPPGIPSGCICGGSSTSAQSSSSSSSCVADCTISWSTSQTGGASWNTSSNSVQINFQDSANCGGSNSSVQSGTAIGTVCGPANLSFNFLGHVETQNSGFETISVKVDGNEIYAGTSPNNNGGCTMTFVSGTAQISLGAGTHTITVDSSTVDGQYHVGAFWNVGVTCMPTGGGGGQGGGAGGGAGGGGGGLQPGGPIIDPVPPGGGQPPAGEGGNVEGAYVCP